MKLVATGCSITHGAELDHPYMSERNAELSYPKQLADMLGLECLNVALSAGSNGYIFQSALRAIRQYDDIEVLIVCWTYPTRLTWQAFDRTYVIHPTFATALKDVYTDPEFWGDRNGVYVSSDSKLVADDMEQMVKYAVEHVIDFDVLEENRKDHQMALADICKQRDIKLIDIHADRDLIKFGNFHDEERHPNFEEHKMIAEWLRSKYFPNSIK